MKMPAWMPRALFESALIVFSVLLALAVDQWRENRDVAARARQAIAAITTELQANRRAAENARNFHQGLHDRLKEIAGRQQIPTAAEAANGMFNPAPLLQTAWSAAREARALDSLPYDLVLKLSRVYEWQQAYSQLGHAIANDVYIDLRRRGFDAVLREGFVGFVLLTSDFAGRENQLIARYDDALAALAALPP